VHDQPWIIDDANADNLTVTLADIHNIKTLIYHIIYI